MAALTSKCDGTLETATARLQQPDLDVSQQDHNQSPQSLNCEWHHFALRDEKCYNIQQQWSKVHLSIMMLLPASCSQIIKH